MTVLAASAGALGVAGAVMALPRPRELPVPFRGLALRLVEEARSSADMLREVGSASTPLPPARMRRLQTLAGLAGLVAGATVFGMGGALLCGVAAGLLAPRAVAARRRRYSDRLDQGADSAARAIADAISAGASLRASIGVAARRLDGPIAVELRQTAAELELGAGTDAALERLRSRSASRALALIVAALQVQRRSGGNLARLLRDVATSLEQDRQVVEEANSATAQARFTALVVVALPACGIALGALAAPGLPGRMAGSPFGAALLIASLALQVAGALMIRRLGRSWR